MKKIFLFLMSFFMFSSAKAEIHIDITGAQTNPISVAVADFSGLNVSQSIRQIIVYDLESSGLFRVIDEQAYLQKMHDVNTLPQFENWQTINAEILLYGTVERQEDGSVKLSFRAWDVLSRELMLAKSLTLSEKDWRRLGHISADMLFEKVTGEKGYFDTRLVYIAESGNYQKRMKRLAMMDYDGANHYYLTDGKTMVLTPRFSPDGKKIAYLSYFKGKPRVYLLDLVSGTEEMIGNFPSMSYAPQFSPDGKKMLLTLTDKGNSEIYLYDIEKKKKTRLTNHQAIDTSATFSPDMKQIVFNSDRSGKPQLYVMDADGQNVKRISFGQKGNYMTPVWSPRGDYIAFTKIESGQFYIGVMKPDGSGERLIAQDFLVEGPSWAPNGRMLVYTRQSPYDSSVGGKIHLHVIDISGRNNRPLKTPQEASDGVWSSLLH